MTKGSRVLYVPKWVHPLDTEHPDCERGVVVAVRADRVLVKFPAVKTPQGCDPNDLRSVQ